jgi:hypothetical protein
MGGSNPSHLAGHLRHAGLPSCWIIAPRRERRWTAVERCLLDVSSHCQFVNSLGVLFQPMMHWAWWL